ncbi:hypothetical protein AcW1_009932 [Taiwanofungus camphoratus]|nr:hypothetical protein AcW1_009932 [Antrodia cinnamomea]
MSSRHAESIRDPYHCGAPLGLAAHEIPCRAERCLSTEVKVPDREAENPTDVVVCRIPSRCIKAISVYVCACKPDVEYTGGFARRPASIEANCSINSMLCCTSGVDWIHLGTQSCANSMLMCASRMSGDCHHPPP